MNLEDVQSRHLGSYKGFTVIKNDTVDLDGSEEKHTINERCELICSSIETTKSEKNIKSD